MRRDQDGDDDRLARTRAVLTELAAVSANGRPRMRTVIVTHSDRGARSVQRQLERACGIGGQFVRVDGGFRAFLRDGARLESLLW